MTLQGIAVRDFSGASVLAGGRGGNRRSDVFARESSGAVRPIKAGEIPGT